MVSRVYSIRLLSVIFASTEHGHIDVIMIVRIVVRVSVLSPVVTGSPLIVSAHNSQQHCRLRPNVRLNSEVNIRDAIRLEFTSEFFLLVVNCVGDRPLFALRCLVT